MSDLAFQKGDIIVFPRTPQGMREKEFIITAIVTKDFDPEIHDFVSVEYANPIKWMSGLANEPHEPINFGDTQSTVRPLRILSHYRPPLDE